MNKHTLLCLSLPLALAACGGSTMSYPDIEFPDYSTDDFRTSLGEHTDEASTLVTYAQLSDLEASLPRDLDATPDDFVPRFGSAQYEGVAYAGVLSSTNPDEDFEAAGRLLLNANFVDGSVTGSADNFFETDFSSGEDLSGSTGVRITGEIEFDFEQDSAGQNFYVGSSRGVLISTSGDSHDFDLEGFGFFYGLTAQQFSALAAETVGDTSTLLIMSGAE